MSKNDAIPVGNAVVSVMPVFTVSTDAPGVEGARGGQRVIGYFLDPQIANQAAKGAGEGYATGSNANVQLDNRVVLTMTATGERFFLPSTRMEPFVISTDDPRAVKQRAEAKLTPEELRAILDSNR